MKKVLSLSLALWLFCCQAEASQNREGKLFSLFNIVQFKNDACTSSSSLSTGSTDYRNGTCFTSSECNSKGGSAKGNCAAGFGVCCVFQYSSTSQTEVNYNDTYLQNPDFPSTYGDTTSLTYKVKKVASNICWLRLDFEQFQTLGPTETNEATGNPCVDKLTITSDGHSVPELCGLLTGEHIYVDLTNSESSTADIKLEFTGTATTRKWDIKVAQIECDAKGYSPPSGCLQWQTGLTGTIQTFNWADTNSVHLASQEYSHCIRPQAGFCCIEYRTCDDTIYSMSLDGTNLVVETTPTAVKALQGTSCLLDYLIIDGSSGSCGDVSLSRYCGGRLSPIKDGLYNVAICDCTAPFFVGIKTDALGETLSSNALNRGTCLKYRQLQC